jgi:hypothetical protein
MKSGQITVALLQISLFWESIERNLDKVEQKIEKEEECYRKKLAQWRKENL